MKRFEVLMKPTGMSKKYNGKRRAPEYLVSLWADDSMDAAQKARATAEIEGFSGYAITKIKEVQQ